MVFTQIYGFPVGVSHSKESVKEGFPATPEIDPKKISGHRGNRMSQGPQQHVPGRRQTTNLNVVPRCHGDDSHASPGVARGSFGGPGDPGGGRSRGWTRP